MSQPRPPGLEDAALESLLGDLISYYQEEAGAGRLRVCRDAALTHRAQRLLDTGAPSRFYLPELLVPGPGTTHSQGAPSPAQHVCHDLVQALEFLELISVNLLLFPWRKEIRSLKVGTTMPLSKGVSGRGQSSASGGDSISIPPTDSGPILQVEKLRAEEVNATYL